MLTATYSPEDNKLRLYSLTRLDAETYTRVRAAGFIWAPKQDLFVAPMWTPSREDLLLELCGEIGDEDTSLVDRAEQRAERFEEYSDNRAQDAESARRAVHAITDNIPFGQPILVGHHSERHARKDAERIENGMRKAVKMWETSKYWQERAQGAIRNAKYKERPDVRARRIKGLEADIRSYRARFTPSSKHVIMQEQWGKNDGVKVPHVFCAPRGGRGGSWVAVSSIPGLESYYSRWIKHCENRLEYERAMLAEEGGTVADQTGPEKGGACKCWAGPRGGYAYIQKVNKVSVTILDNWGNGGENFTRTIPFDKLTQVMTAAQVQEKREAGLLVETADKTGFFLSDAPSPETQDEENQRLHSAHIEAIEPEKPDAAAFDAMKDQLKAGVAVVSAPQLFPTPPELAKRMADEAGALAGKRILEPSAGTGNILRAILNNATGAECVHILAIEVNHSLVKVLEQQRRKTLYANESNFQIRCADFLECAGDLGKFDCILMNPPFANAQDIKHIQHALTMLKPGGRLIAICANGPKQNQILKPIVDDHGGTWEVLPPGTFKDSGTNVSSVMLSVLLS
jgi:phospholipid N-methyltransferase